MQQIDKPIPLFFDTDGGPLNSGSVYIGTASRNPESSPIQVYWDAAGTQPAAQPLKTLNGYISRNGTPARVYVNAATFSMTARDANSALVFTLPDVQAAADGSVVANLSGASGSSLVGFGQGGTGASTRTVQDKLRELVSVKDFGAVGDGVTDDTAAINAAITYVDSLGGGAVFFPPGTYATSTGITVGNGSNAAPASVHNKVRLIGFGYGGSSSIINQQINGASRILYTGTPNANAAVLTFAGPIYGNQVDDLTLDCAAKAGRGMIVNHLTMGTFNRVSARNYTTVGFDLTTRTGFPVGCAFGCADNRFYDCYGWLDDASLASASIIGVSLNSGVSTAVSLVGQPDSARNVFVGGTFMYGTTASSYGAWLSGADNNTFIEPQFYPYGGATAGYDIYFNQWPASGNFPLENFFSNPGMTRGVSGNGGVGSAWGNTIFPFPTGDGAPFPSLSGVSGVDHTGKTYVAGVRAYRNRQSASATLNTSVQSATGIIATLGAITGGTGYTNGTYNNVPLTGGAGVGATANITVSGGAVTAVTIVNGGTGYAAANTLSANTSNLGGTGGGFSVPVATVTTTTLTNVPGLSVSITTLASSKLRVSFSGRASKGTSSSGYFSIAINGSAQGETRTDVNADGFWHAVTAEGLYAVGAGTQTVTVQFASADGNTLQISHGSLVVEELY